MRKNRKKLGFTMAELLIVVAIIGILGGVSFIAVSAHQRSLKQLECDTIAKEIFIAAQNHLTMAESQGFLAAGSGTSYFGADADEKNAHIIVGPGSGNILDLMLPFGSIDEIVRHSGSYLIHYQTNPAQVLDVYYSDPNAKPSRFQHTITASEYSSLPDMAKATKGEVVGHYGGEDALDSGDIILAPTVEVINTERLTVHVTDTNRGNATGNNPDAALKLIITGESSGAKVAISFPAITSTHRRYGPDATGSGFIVVLDDVTTAYDSSLNDGLHFAELNNYKTENAIIQFMQNDKEETPSFLPGEDITV